MSSISNHIILPRAINYLMNSVNYTNAGDTPANLLTTRMTALLHMHVQR